MAMDERWVLGTPEEMARATIESSRERIELVIEDLLARPSETPIVAEGPWLFPEFTAPLVSSDRQAIWLVPTTEFRERALARSSDAELAHCPRVGSVARRAFVRLGVSEIE